MGKPWAAGILATLAVFVLLWQLLIGLPWGGGSVSAVAVEYESDASVDQREMAVVAMSRQGRASVPRLREVLARDAEPAVRASAIQGLGDHYDFDSLDLLINEMASPSPVVRMRAHQAVARMVGITIVMDEQASDAQWRRAAEQYRQTWQGMRGSERLREFQAKLDRNFGAIP